MTNIWSKQADVQVFDCESIMFKSDVNIFERMGIAEYIYEGVVEPSYKNLLGNMPTVLVTTEKLEQKTPSQILNPR